MNKYKFIPAYLLTFVNVLGFSILLPVLPFVVEQYGCSEIVYGALISIYSIFQALGAPYLGRLSDSLGRKPVLLISQAGTLLSWIIFGVAYFLPNIHILGFSVPILVIAVARVLDGITGGNNSVTQAYVTDVATLKEKSLIFGSIGGIVGVGMIVGPGLGGFLSSGSWGYLGTVIGAAILSMVTLCSISLWLKESHPEEKRRPFQRESLLFSIRLHHRIQRLNPSKVIRNIFVLRGIFSIMMAAYVGTIALFIIDLFHFNEQQLGVFMLVVGLFIAFNQAVVSKWFIRRWGEYWTMRLGLCCTVVGLWGITTTLHLWLYIFLYYWLNLGISLCIPCFNALLALHAPSEQAGEVMGISGAIISLSNAFVPICAAALYGLYGASIYWVLALLPLLALLYSFQDFDPERDG